MGIEIKQKEGEVTRVEVREELTIYTVAAYWERLQPELSRGAALQLELTKVTEIDSAGVQLLLALERISQQRGGRIELIAPSTPVQEMLQLFQLAAAFGATAAGGGHG